MISDLNLYNFSENSKPMFIILYIWESNMDTWKLLPLSRFTSPLIFWVIYWPWFLIIKYMLYVARIISLKTTFKYESNNIIVCDINNLLVKYVVKLEPKIWWGLIKPDRDSTWQARMHMWWASQIHVVTGMGTLIQNAFYVWSTIRRSHHWLDVHLSRDDP